MSDNDPGLRKVAGYNQFIKLVRRGKAKRVFLASDAELLFASNVRRELSAHPEIKLDETHSSLSLAEITGVEVRTFVVTECI